MSESNTRAEIVEVMARGIATRHYMRRFEMDATAPQVVENVRANWWTWADEAEAAYDALEASGRAVVPRRALEQIVNLSDCGFAVDVAEQALAAPLPPSKE